LPNGVTRTIVVTIKWATDSGAARSIPAGARPEDWRIALDLIRTGKVTMDPLVSDASFLPLENIQDAF